VAIGCILFLCFCPKVISDSEFSILMQKSGENGSEIIARLKRDLLPTLIGGALFWPVCDFVTFKYIPVHLQVCTCR
jgi:hypothetical protein